MSRPRRVPAHSELLRTDTIRADTPLRLDVAAALAYPDGSMTVSGLRREAARGRLVIERVAGKDYTTLAQIERMRELCRLKAKAPASISDARDTTRPGELRMLPFTSSETVAISEAQAALRTILAEPNDASPSTSPGSMNDRPGEPATVTRSKSRSLTY